MARSLILQNFALTDTLLSSEPEPAPPEPELPMPDMPDALESYDAGYKCGWSDCADAEAAERVSVGADLAKNLSEATLTYADAKRDVIAALGPFFEDVVTTLLPEMAAAALTPTVIAEVTALAEGQTLAKFEVHAAPSACAALERLAETEHLEGVTVRPEPAFAEGQVSIRAGSERRDLDMAAAAARIAEAIKAFNSQNCHSDT